MRDLILIILVSIFTGCTTRGTSLTAGEVSKLAAFDYPSKAPYGADLPILVTHKNHALHFHHAGSVAPRDGYVWINAQYVHAVPILQVGSETSIDLLSCINRHREPFPVGAGLRRDLDHSPLQVEWYDPQKNIRHRMRVLVNPETLIRSAP